MNEICQPVETKLGVINGRDSLLIDYFDFNCDENTLVLSGSLSLTNRFMQHISAQIDAEQIFYATTFRGVMAFSVLELDSWIRLNRDRDSQSSFDEITNFSAKCRLQNISWTDIFKHIMNADEAEKIASAVNSSITAITVFVGGIAAYFKFISGRVYAWRLETALSGTVKSGKDSDSLHIIAEVKNIGVSRASIAQRFGDKQGTGIYIYGADSCSDLRCALPADWNCIGNFEAFLHQKFIESGESASEECQIELPKDFYKTYRVELLISSLKPSWMWWRKGKGTTWTVSSIVNYPESGTEQRRFNATFSR